MFQISDLDSKTGWTRNSPSQTQGQP